MKYYKVNIETTEKGIEIVLAELDKLGYDNIEVSDPRDVLWSEENLMATEYIDKDVRDNEQSRKPMLTLYLDDDGRTQDKYAILEEAMRSLNEIAFYGGYGIDVDLGSLAISIQEVDDSNWKDKWKAYYKPIKIGDNIVIKPSWEKYEKTNDEKIIEIDPGMAFGTGMHETTELCARFIEKYMSGDKETMIDVGCGTGILAIIGAMLGANEVMAIDIEEDAVEAAKNNVKKNNVSNIVSVMRGNLTEGVSMKADIIAGNLLAALVKELSKDVPKHLNENGVFISSGILIEQEDEVKKALENNGFKVEDVLRKGEWCALACKLDK